MNKTIKKVLSLVMVVMMVMSVVPVSAFAGFWDDLSCTVGNHDCKWVVTKDATCSEVGTRVYKCVNCNAIEKSETIAMLAHTPQDMPAEAATCTKDGHTAGQVCSVCGTLLGECKTVPATGHKPVDMPAIEATCESNGLTKGSKCSVCDLVLAAQVSIPALGHKWAVTSRVEPTCSKKGVEIKICSTCKKTESTTLDEAHVFGNWKIKTAPTCEEKGVMVQTCTKCKAEVESEIPATGHTEISVAKKEPTCAEPGAEAGKRCATCDKIIEGCTYIAPTGHSSAKIEGYAATCTKEGLSDGYYCPKCNYVFTEQTKIEPLGHAMAYDAASSKAATCTSTGLSVMKCSRKGCTETTTEVLPITHNVKWTIAPAATCTTDGKKTGYCSICKQTVSEVIPATGHTVSNELSWKVKTQATCTKDGVMTAVCDTCGKEATKAIPATGHKEVKVDAKAPTCTKPGLTEGTKCYYCGIEMKAQEVIPAAHTYDKAEIVTPATCSKEGEQKFTCTVCKKFITEKIEKLPHTEVNIEAKPNTCTQDGNEAGVECSVCGAIIKEAKVIPATGHNWVDAGDSKAPTCTEAGYDNYRCSQCGETKTGTVEATGHKNTETVAGTAADCINSGITEGIKCKDCGAWIQEQTTIPALDHDWIIDSANSYPSTCETEGLNYYNCTRCAQHKQETVPVIDHAWGEWITDVEATCNTSGTKHRECAVCKLTQTEEIPNGGGCNIVNSEYVAPTCTTPGYTGGTHCDKCNTVYTAPTEIPALGHNYVDQTIPATTETNGSSSLVCENCGDAITDVIAKIKTIKLSSTSVTYNGKSRKPSVTVVDDNDEALVVGTDFTYSYSDEILEPGTYTITVKFKGKYSGTETYDYLVRPGKTSSVTTSATTKGTTKITWNAVHGATGYRVYIYSAVNGGKGKKIASVSGTSYTLTKDYNGKALKMGTEYKIYVRAYTKDDDGNVVHASSGVTKTFKQLPGKVTLKASSTTGKANLSWTNITGETGYQVYYATSKNGKYTKLANTNANVVKYSRSLTRGKTYYFKVRAYTKVGSGYVYGSFSSAVACKIK